MLTGYQLAPFDSDPAQDSASCSAGLCCDGSCQDVECCSNADCSAPNTCGGGGTPGVCGCTKKTCADYPGQCGSLDDGCGGTLNCGVSCPASGCCTSVNAVCNIEFGDCCESGKLCGGGTVCCSSATDTCCEVGGSTACCASGTTCNSETGTCDQPCFRNPSAPQPTMAAGQDAGRRDSLHPRFAVTAHLAPLLCGGGRRRR